jgi:hypothetical protein
MKGLIIATIIVFIIIGIGIGISAYIYNDLVDSVAVARETGFQKGYAKGDIDGVRDGNEAGYQEGSKAGYTQEESSVSSDSTAEYFLYNPTYAEVQEMLVESRMDSAKEIQDYAELNGIRAGYVRCPIARPATEGRVYLYQLVAFETVDKGLVIIEPWSYKEVKVEVGKSYRELNGFPSSPYDDTITKITIVW